MWPPGTAFMMCLCSRFLRQLYHSHYPHLFLPKFSFILQTFSPTSQSFHFPEQQLRHRSVLEEESSQSWTLKHENNHFQICFDVQWILPEVGRGLQHVNRGDLQCHSLQFGQKVQVHKILLHILTLINPPNNCFFNLPLP